MTIAININYFFPSPDNDCISRYWLHIASETPEHRFIFIGAPVFNEKQVLPGNASFIQSYPARPKALFWKFWLNYRLLSIVRKHGADLLIHLGGVCSLRSKLPQYMFVSDCSFYDFPQFHSTARKRFFEKNLPLFIKKADHIVTASGYLLKELIKRFPFINEKATAIPLAPAEHYTSKDWNEKEVIKDQYAAGKEYFLFNGGLQERYQLINLLKAFSFFKARQKSNMQLVLVTSPIAENDLFMQRLKTYRYRNEVIVFDKLDEKEIAEITSAAYAFVYPAIEDGTAIFPLQAMQSHVPVIAAQKGALIEMAGEAALYADPEKFEELAAKMMLLFKDENERAKLIAQAVEVVRQNSTATIDRHWNQLINKTVAIPGESR